MYLVKPSSAFADVLCILNRYVVNIVLVLQTGETPLPIPPDLPPIRTGKRPSADGSGLSSPRPEVQSLWTCTFALLTLKCTLT